MLAPGSGQEAEGDLADTGTRVWAGVSTIDQKRINIDQMFFYSTNSYVCYISRICLSESRKILRIYFVKSFTCNCTKKSHFSFFTSKVSQIAEQTKPLVTLM